MKMPFYGASFLLTQPSAVLSDELEAVSLQPPDNQQREQRARFSREPEPLEIALLI